MFIRAESAFGHSYGGEACSHLPPRQHMVKVRIAWQVLSADPVITGTVLAALQDTGAATVKDAALQRGLRYLLKAQATDGSWCVRKRTDDVQPFLDSNFPHGLDQFISIPATSWATYALLRALPKTEKQPYLAAHPQAVARVLASITKPSGFK